MIAALDAGATKAVRLSRTGADDCRPHQRELIRAHAPELTQGGGEAVHGPEWGQDYPDAIPLTCPAGSIFVMDGRVWHQTGPNTTRNERRIGMFAYYVRPFIRPQVVWQDLVPPPLRETLTLGLRELLGFGERATRNLQTMQGRQIWLDEKTPPQGNAG